MLYNELRPQTVDELFGQPLISKTIKSMNIESIPHTIILHGESGVGKTTAARLIAKKVHCSSPTSTGDVCGVCDSCKHMESDPDTFPDYFEIDGAESGGVDDVRELKGKAAYKTFSGKPRIIYIDEVQALSKQAFQALLKITEEPGNNIFLFATTDLDKIPSTIQTRSLKLNFKSPKQDELKDFIKKTCGLVGLEIEDEAAGIIAFTSGKSYREITTVLGHIISVNGKNKITTATLTADQFVFEENTVSAIKSFAPLYFKRDWYTLLDVIGKMPSEDKLASDLGYYMYNISRKTIMTKLSKGNKHDILIDIKFAELLSSALATRAITKMSIENILYKMLLG